MPPKAVPKAKQGAAAKGKAKTTPSTEPAAATLPPAQEVLSVPEAEVAIEEVPDEQWAQLLSVEEPAEPVGKAVEALLTLLGDAAPGGPWPVARASLADRASLGRELRALGPWGPAEAQLAPAEVALKAADLSRLRRPAAVGSGAAAATALKGGAAKGKAKAKVVPGATVAPPPLPLGAEAALALGCFVEAVLAMRGDSEERPPGFPEEWPTYAFARLHERLQSAMFGGQNACVICQGSAAAAAAALYCERSDAVVCDVSKLQVQVGLTKSLTVEEARARLGEGLKAALAGGGRRLALRLGAAAPDVSALCGAGFPAEALDLAKAEEVAKAFGVGGGVPSGFHVVVLAEASKVRAEAVLPQRVPGFGEMAVLLLNERSLPSGVALQTMATDAAAGPPCLRAALRLLALPPAAEAVAPVPAPAVAAAGDAAGAPAALDQAAGGAAGDAATAPAAAVAEAAQVADDDLSDVNMEDFEYSEAFGEDWERRWSRGPHTKDEHGKEIRANLIKSTLVKYPANPKDAKSCMQLVGGSPNAPCTGIRTSFAPLARPTEVEFEFTVNGKVDMPNACVVFTEQEFKGALPDCKVGIQFCVRGGMQLSGGGGTLVRISNDGKIQNDKWNKVLLKIDWSEKVVVGQVDTRGKGYAPAIQTVPFRDDKCKGFGHLYIYNTDMQATCWFHSLRIKQDATAQLEDTDGLEARAHLAKRMREREYQRAVDADMAVGMKMGAIKSTQQHGMNLAEEQRANNYAR